MIKIEKYNKEFENAIYTGMFKIPGLLNIDDNAYEQIIQPLINYIAKLKILGQFNDINITLLNQKINNKDTLTVRIHTGQDLIIPKELKNIELRMEEPVMMKKKITIQDIDSLLLTIYTLGIIHEKLINHTICIDEKACKTIEKDKLQDMEELKTIYIQQLGNEDTMRIIYNKGIYLLEHVIDYHKKLTNNQLLTDVQLGNFYKAMGVFRSFPPLSEELDQYNDNKLQEIMKAIEKIQSTLRICINS